MSVLLNAQLPFLLFFFFFSSRRRHTRFDCDWSSDVCSSDLGDQLGKTTGWIHRTSLKARSVAMGSGVAYERIDDAGLHIRSEERRVGKECRSRWSPYH